jgi:general secretion pathway protein J
MIAVSQHAIRAQQGRSCNEIGAGGRRYTAGGFTLLEVLIAVAIFVIVGTLAFTGYNELSRQSDRLGQSMARVRAVQTTMQRMAQDFMTLEPRPVREPLGDGMEPALRADARTEQLAEFTHSGWSNPAGIPRPTLQRVAYRVQNNKLRRDYWVMLDRTLTSQPVSTVMIDRVRSVKLRFMDSNRNWQEQWPPLGSTAAVVSSSPADALSTRPIAVEITLDLEDWGRLVRLVEVSG